MRIGWFGYGGNSWQADQFRDEFAAVGVQLVTCHEYPNADVPFSPGGIFSFLNSMDSVILPARVEAQPAKSVNRLAQAWSAGKACIIAPLPAYLKYAVHQQNALVVKKREDWATFAKLLKDDSKLRQSLGENGRNVAYQHLHPRDLISKLMGSIGNSRAFVQIIIPHYADRGDYVSLAVSSALDAGGPQKEIFLISSAPRHPFEYPELKKFSGKIRVHHQLDRLSFSQANNLGLTNLHPETTHVLLLNDDTIISKNALSRMIEVIGDQQIILNPYSNCDQSWLHNDQLILPSSVNVTLHPGMNIESITAEDVFNLRNFDPSQDKTLRSTPFCAMYSTLIPKSVLDKVGLLSTEFSNGGEDADYSYRAQAVGVGTYWTKAAFVFHFGGRTRKFAETQNRIAHHEEDKQNNSLLTKKWGKHGSKKKRIAIWTGPAWEKWDLNSYLTTGIGGSETCAGRLAQTAAENGCSVTMYGYHDPHEQDGVVLKPYTQFVANEEYFDLFISSRHVTPISKSLRAKRKLVWVHDIWLLTGQVIPQEQLDLVDSFAVLSPWHQEFFSNHHQISPTRTTIIPNGINTELFGQVDLDRKIYGRLQWSSSPDRGLDNLIYCLPWIRDKIPEIHLDVYYGFYNWKSAAQQRNNQDELARIAALESDLEKVKDCVKFKDRVNQKELAQRWMEAYAWAYPTLFTETYCITAKEAQVSGTPIVCSDVAALQTTVGEFGTIIRDQAYSKEGRLALISEIEKLHKDKDYWVKSSKKALEGSKRINWQARWEDYWSKWLE